MRSMMPRWPNSLRNRVLAVLLASMAASALLVGGATTLLWDPFTRWMLRDLIEDDTQGLVKHLQFDAQGRPVGWDPAKIEPWMFESLRAEVLVRVADADGRIVLANDEHAQMLAADGQTFTGRRQSFTFHRKGVAMHAATAPFKSGGQRWYLQFAVSDRMVLRMRESVGVDVLRQGTLALGATFLVVFLVTIHLALRQALNPVRQASDAARQIAPRTLDARLPAAEQPLELRPLVDAFNQALDRLQAGFKTQQAFLSNAAHELKTPLALIRAQAERVDADRGRERMLRDVDQVARQVQQLLLLAEASEGQNYRVDTIDPKPSIREVFDFMERVADRHGVTLGLQMSPAPARWRADRGALFTLLKNLLENAIQHSPADGVVKLQVSAAGFEVADEGEGVADHELPRIFERFWRGAGRREQGAGLGLSICSEIATVHGWRLTAHRLSPGFAIRCEMAVPLA